MELFHKKLPTEVAGTPSCLFESCLGNKKKHKNRLESRDGNLKMLLPFNEFQEVLRIFL